MQAFLQIFFGGFSALKSHVPKTPLLVAAGEISCSDGPFSWTVMKCFSVSVSNTTDEGYGKPA